MNPLPDESGDIQVGSSVTVVGEEFLRTLKEEGGQGFALILKPKDESDFVINKGKDTPKEVLQLLERYKCIVVDEMPNTLPPIRDISHLIELIPGDTLPNKAAYKMTPSQNEEITR